MPFRKKGTKTDLAYLESLYAGRLIKGCRPLARLKNSGQQPIVVLII